MGSGRAARVGPEGALEALTSAMRKSGQAFKVE